MAFKLKKKEFTAEQIQKLQEVSNAQKVSTGFQPTTDGSLVFRTPGSIEESKVFVYVPNFSVEIDGKVELRADRPIFHSIKIDGREQRIRCTQGAEALGYSTCPLCEKVSIHWDYAKEAFKAKCEKNGLDPESDADDVKTLRSAEYGARAIKNANKFITFPIVVINNKEKAEDGFFKREVVWYTANESFFKEKWAPALKPKDDGEATLDDIAEETTLTKEELEAMVVNPAGKFFILDYSKGATKNGSFSKMQAALKIEISEKKFKGQEKWASVLDEEAKGFTPERAAQVIVNNTWYDEEDLEDLANEITNPVIQKLEFLQARGAVDYTAQAISKPVENVAIEANNSVEVEIDEDFDLDEEQPLL